MPVKFDLTMLLAYKAQGVTAASFGCVMILSYLAASITWQVVDSPVIEMPKLNQSSSTGAEFKAKTYNYNVNQMKNWHLFGKEAPKPVDKGPAPVTTPVTTQVKETKLPLTLMGVFAAPDPKMSSAVIATNSTKSKGGEYFKIGQEVQSGAVLNQVLADHVVLKVRGNFQSLYFENAEKNKGASKPASRPPTRPNNKPRNVPQKPATKVNPNNIKTPEQFMKTAKSELAKDPINALASVGLEPVSGDGSSSGYRISKGSASKNLTKYGLQSGDVIISINDMPVGNVEQDQDLIDEIFDSGTAKVVIQRGDFRFTVNHKF